MVTANMKKIIDQYNINTKNMFKSASKPQVSYDFSKQKTLNGNWVNSWNPTTASPTAKAALTSIKKNQGVDTTPWWQDALHGLGTAIDYIDRARNTVDTAFNHYLKGQSKGQMLADINPIAAIINGLSKDKNGKMNYANAWEGAKAGFTGKEKTHYSKVLDAVGWKINPKDKSLLGILNKIAHGTVGFAGDVASDPLTYLTFGGESVVKTAAKPFVEDALKETALKGAKKGTKEFTEIMAKHVESDAAQSVIKAAQAKANNSLVSIGVPFGKRLTLVNKPAFMRKETQKISEAASQGMASMMKKSGLTSDADRYEILSHLVGRPIKSTKDLNTQEYDFINQVWHDGLGKSVETHYNPSNLPDPFGGALKPKANAPKSEWENFVNTHWQTVMGQPLPTSTSQMTVKNLKNLSKHLYNHLEQVRKTNYTNALQQALGNVKNDFNTMGKAFQEYKGLTGFSPATKKLFVKQGTRGLEATKLGKFQEGFGKVFGSRRFVPLSNQIIDHRIQGGLSHALNASNKMYAYAHDMVSKLEDIAKTPEFRQLSKDDWREVAYAIEGKRPTFAGYVPPDPAKQSMIDHVAKLLVGDPNNPASKNFLKELTDLEQTAGVPYTIRPNYFPHVYNQENGLDFNELSAQLMNMGQSGEKIAAGLRNGTSGFQKARTNFESMADLADALHLAEQNGNNILLDAYKNVSWNPLEAFGKRAINGMHQVAKREAVNNILKDGLALDSHMNLAGWVKPEDIMNIPTGSPLEMLKGKLIPKDVANDLSKVNKLLTNDVALNQFVDKADHVLSILRRNYTVTKVGFHVRQSIGNVFQNTLAGVNVSAYNQAIKYLKNPDHYEQWTKELLENGIIHTGTSGADLANNLGEELSTKLLDRVSVNPVSQNFFLARAGRKAGEWEDNVARAAHYMYMRGKGLTQEQAADSVRKYLFNYSEISTAGQWWRRVIPFYQWMRNNLPFQLLNTVKNPKVYNITQNLLNDFQDRPSDQEAMKLAGINNPLDQEVVQKLIDENGGTLPKYIQDNYIKTPWGYYSIGLPIQDLKQATHDPAAYFFGGMNPYISLIAKELPSNENSLNNAPIDKSVPKGSSIWTSSGGLNHIGETAIGSPWQIVNGTINGLSNGDWSNVWKGLGTKTQEADPAKTINNLLYQKALEMNTKAKALKEQNGGN